MILDNDTDDFMDIMTSHAEKKDKNPRRLVSKVAKTKFEHVPSTNEINASISLAMFSTDNVEILDMNSPRA